MFAKPVFPFSILIEPHSCSFTLSPPPTISLKKVLFHSYLLPQVQPHPSTETEQYYNTWTLGQSYQGDGGATATTVYAPGAKHQN